MPPKPKKYTLGQKKASDLIDLTLPSGETCQARRPGVQGFIAAGVLDNFDELSALVQTEHIDKHTAAGQARVSREQALKAAEGMATDPAKLATSIQMVDRLVVYAVTQPEVWVDYQLIGEKDEEWATREKEWKEADKAFQDAEKSGKKHDVSPPPIAVRDIDLMDKMFLVTWAVGGTPDLTAFRKEFSGLVGDMEAIEGVSRSAE